ncbi:MAG: nucleotidyltransferase domain-containing protein [Chitinophagales bacterium]|nr:nucleotidyltransferase domain-containing protein [Chitinophagales bacterium]
MELLEKNKKQIAALCEQHDVISLSLFGSLVKGTANQNSDVDLLVTFGDMDIHGYADNYYHFAVALENLLGRKVDLITEKSITNPYLLKSINRNRVTIYERGNPSMAA